MIFYDFIAFALFSSLSEWRNMGGVGGGCFVFSILVTVFLCLILLLYAL